MWTPAPSRIDQVAGMAMEELDNEALEGEIELLRQKLERLRVLYEQFFMGVEKTPPYNAQKDVVRLVHRLTHVRIRSTTLKFRLQTLIQRFSSHKAYWARTMREIEDGTYRKHKLRQRSKEKATEERDDVLTAADHQAINAVRDKLGESAAKEAEARRRAERTEAGDLATSFMQELERDTDGDRVKGPLSQQRRTRADRLGGAGADEDDFGADTGASGASAAEVIAASAPSSGGGTYDGPRGVSAEELAKRAEKLRAMRDKLARMGVTDPRLERALGGRAAGSDASEQAAPRPQATPRPPAPARPQPAPRPQAAMAESGGDARARAVYERLIDTKRRLNEPTGNLNFDSVKRSLDKQAKQVREKRGCKDVDFDVVVKDGKAYLKAIPR